MQSKLVLHSRSSIQNNNNWRLSTRKTEGITHSENHKDDNDYDIIDKSYLNKKDPNKAKYQYIFGKHEKNGLEHYKHAKTYIEFLNNIKGVYKNIHKYNSDKTQKILIVLDAMITDMISNKTSSPIATELFIMSRKLNISIAFI